MPFLLFRRRSRLLHRSTFGGPAVALPGYSPECGPWWTVVSGAWQVSDGLLQPGSSGLALVETAAADCTVTATLAPSGDRQYLVFRAAGAADHWMVQWAKSTGIVYLQLQLAGIWSTEASAAGHSSGTELSVQLSGSTIRVYAAGVLAIEHTSAALITETRHGLFSDTIPSKWPPTDSFEVVR